MDVCVFSVISQCMFPNALRRVKKHGVAIPGPDRRLSPELLAEHIYVFSLAGIQAVRKRQESRSE